MIKNKKLEVLTCAISADGKQSKKMLGSASFAEALKKLAIKYDRIVIDSPPVMLVADARIVAALCNVTILVLRSEESTRKVSQHACNGLLSVGAKLIGTVVNGVSKRNGQYGYYAGYGYGHYGHSHNENKTAKTYSEKTSAES